jgi:hypothetical protein
MQKSSYYAGINIFSSLPSDLKNCINEKALFKVIPSERSYKKRPEKAKESHPCGGGSEYLHRDPESRLKSETVKYGHESQGTRTRERLRWRGSSTYIKDRPVVSSERAPHKNKTVTVKQ